MSKHMFQAAQYVLRYILGELSQNMRATLIDVCQGIITAVATSYCLKVDWIRSRRATTACRRTNLVNRAAHEMSIRMAHYYL